MTSLTSFGESRPMDFVRRHAVTSPTRTAIEDAGSSRSLTYAELDRAIGCAVSILHALGISAGDRVGALSRNSIELVVLQLACARTGAILVPFNWRLSQSELEWLIADCRPRLLFGDACLERLRSLGIEKLTASDFASRLATTVPSTDVIADLETPSLMLYTSGSTGIPKGVVLTERNLLATAVNFASLGEVDEQSVFLIDVPMFHVIGMVTSVRPALMAGARIVVSQGFDAATTLGRFADRSLGITHYFCVPQISAMLREHADFDPAKLFGLRALFTGGAPHPADDIRKWLDDGIAAVDGYGMTEAGTVLGMPLDCEQIRRKAGSAGMMPPTIEHRIADTKGEPVEPGAVGELLIRGPSLFERYWNNPDATGEAFTPDGFFRTGDLVRRDEDGFFFIVDRLKDMFISGGENVYPVEIEAVLGARPDIVEAAVVGMPDARWGEVGHAFVVLKSGTIVDEDGLRQTCEAALARFKCPRVFHFIARLPRTASGKIAKPELRKLAALE